MPHECSSLSSRKRPRDTPRSAKAYDNPQLAFSQSDYSVNDNAETDSGSSLGKAKRRRRSFRLIEAGGEDDVGDYVDAQKAPISTKDKLNVATNSAQPSRVSFDYDDWQNLKGLFAKAVECYESELSSNPLR
jgi:hypothetical protein